MILMTSTLMGVSPSPRVSSFVDDTRVKKGISHSDNDGSTPQGDLQVIYQWGWHTRCGCSSIQVLSAEILAEWSSTRRPYSKKCPSMLWMEYFTV